MTDEEARRLAGRFWRLVETAPRYPLELEPLVLRALPIAIVKVPFLSLSAIHDWLLRRHAIVEAIRGDRCVRGCLIARTGRGIVFIDGSDTAEEQRFSLAHEIAHFLLEHLWPREAALRRLGPGIADVMAGQRLPTAEERLDSLLRGIELGTLVHLLDRGPGGAIHRQAVLEAEDRADRLALELLAPKSLVVKRFLARGDGWRQTEAVSTTTSLLKSNFGLPPATADSYARMVVWSCRTARSFREWLAQ